VPAPISPNPTSRHLEPLVGKFIWINATEPYSDADGDWDFLNVWDSCEKGYQLFVGDWQFIIYLSEGGRFPYGVYVNNESFEMELPYSKFSTIERAKAYCEKVAAGLFMNRQKAIAKNNDFIAEGLNFYWENVHINEEERTGFYGHSVVQLHN
jgi:hypothetical protein